MSAYNHEAVIAILSARSELIDWAAKEERVKQLCAIAVAQTATEDYVDKIEDEELSFINGQLKMPVGTIRVLRVRSMDGQRLRWRKVNTLDAHILDFTQGTVRVDRWCIPQDPNGLPPIGHYQLEYCAAVCEFYILRDAWLNKEISRIDMETMKQDMRNARKVATAKRVSVDEMEAAIWMLRNGLRFPNADVLKTI